MGELPLVGGGDVGEQHPGGGAGDADQHEEVLVDGDHPDRAVGAGDLAQRVAQGVDGVEGGRGDVLHLPVAVLEEGDQRVVDLAVLFGHGDPSPGFGPLQCRRGRRTNKAVCDSFTSGAAH